MRSDFSLIKCMFPFFVFFSSCFFGGIVFSQYLPLPFSRCMERTSDVFFPFPDGVFSFFSTL